MNIITKTISNVFSGIGRLFSIFNPSRRGTTQLTMSPVHGTSVNIPEEPEGQLQEPLSSQLIRIYRETPSRLLGPFSRLNIRSSVSATRTPINYDNHNYDFDLTPVATHNSIRAEEVGSVDTGTRRSPEFVIDTDIMPTPSFSSRTRRADTSPSSSDASRRQGSSRGRRKRRAAHNSSAPPTRRSRPVETEEHFPCIEAHRLIAHGRVEFHVRRDEDPANDKWLEECEMNPELILGPLHDYRKNVSGVHYDYHDHHTYYPFDDILDHRLADDGTIVYFVSWAGEWTHPVWRSELSEEEAREKANEVCEEYNEQHGL